ncbi:MAG: hypothetical protein HZA08_05895 [Nitrospirae bacterium]|nr:hypothetical protein [Nitrospirota bacterium]
MLLFPMSSSTYETQVAKVAKIKQCVAVKERLNNDGVYINWRISPEPFLIKKEELSFIESLGSYFYQFYKASNKLYYESIAGIQPSWVAGYLDQGKPQSLVEYARMNRMRGLLPAVIRPDIILTEDGMIVSELDSVPGGIGKTGAMGIAYSTIMGDDVAGGADGMVTGFMNMLKTASRNHAPVIAIVVSEESGEYSSEMEWVAKEIRERGGKAFCLRPEEVVFTEDGLFLENTPPSPPFVRGGISINNPPLEKGGEGEFDSLLKIDIIYRFFELFDLKNIPKTELMMYSAKKRKVAVTPPFKHILEEKLLYALFHHPVLKGYWVKELGEDAYETLHRIFPATWILDPAEMPPYGVIPDLKIGARQVSKWEELTDTTQTEREYVIKPSGFSELAWGSRGVVAGHDISKEEWGTALRNALGEFHKTPHILQKFHRGRHVDVRYLDEKPHPHLNPLPEGEEISLPFKGRGREGMGLYSGELRNMKGRVRLCPYYFVEGEEVNMRGIMATVCSLEKKLIHGMEDAVITAVNSD